MLRVGVGSGTVRGFVPETSAELQHVRDLVLRYGWNATAYQIINPGIRHWFSHRHEAVIGYVDFHHVRVVAGAPVCGEAELPEVCWEFEADAREEGCAVCYFGAESRLEGLMRASENHAMVLLGAQPSFHPQDWAGMIGGHASLRAQLNRARNKAVTVTEYPSGYGEGNYALQDCLHEWLDARGLPPLHFLVEPETLARLFDRRLFVAEQRGSVVGFLVASPVPQRNGWLIEQIIRGRAAPNGTAELLIDAAVRRFAAENEQYVTLGLSALSRRVSVQMKENPLWVRAVLAWLRAHGRRFYNFEGLDAFKGKFRPRQWEPVYAICNRPRFTPGMLYAIAGAFTGGRPFRMGFRGLAHAFAREVGWGSSAVERTGCG